MKRLATAALWILYWLAAALLILIVCAVLNASDFACGLVFGGLAVGALLSSFGPLGPCPDCCRDRD